MLVLAHQNQQLSKQWKQLAESPAADCHAYMLIKQVTVIPTAAVHCTHTGNRHKFTTHHVTTDLLLACVSAFQDTGEGAGQTYALAPDSRPSCAWTTHLDSHSCPVP